MTTQIQPKGREERLAYLEKVKQEQSQHIREWKIKEDLSIQEAYSHASQADLFQAYQCLDRATKERAAGFRDYRESFSFFTYATMIKPHWEKLNQIAFDAASQSTQAMTRYQSSISMLEKQKQENMRGRN